MQLLCERGQSYEDIAGLLGIGGDDARQRARAALGEIGGADPDSDVNLTDYMLGQADPIGRADAVRHLQQDPEALELAKRMETGLLEIAPAAKLPRLPEPRGKRRRAAIPAPGDPVESPDAGTATAADGAPATPRRERIDARQSRMLAILGGVGVVLVIAILLVAGVFSGDDGESTSATTAATEEDAAAAAAEEARNITSVRLQATGGSGVAGNADFGLVNNQQLYIDLDVQGLDPSPKRDSAYFAWLMIGPRGGYPINNPVDSPIAPDENGSYSGRIAVPSAVALTVGSQATSVKLSTSSIPEIRAAARRAAQQQAPILPFTGTELATGDIPVVEGGAPADSGGG